MCRNCYYIIIAVFLLNFSDFDFASAQQSSTIRAKRPVISSGITGVRGGAHLPAARQGLLGGQSLQVDILPLEIAIDPDTYKLGPGDILKISFWGEFNESVDLHVLPQGNIILPTVGNISVNGKTITEANARVRDLSKSYYPASDVSVTLLGIRSFIVYVAGEVNRTGNFTATPVDRISNILALAGGMTRWADRRHVELKRTDGTLRKIDFQTFEKRGRIGENPLLQGGDIIYIPRLQISKGTVFVEGNIGNPGHYQFYEGETLADLLDRIEIAKETTDWENASIERASGTETTHSAIIPIDFTEAGASVPEDFLLQDKDKIYLPKKINEVFVEGAVRVPGSYPYRLNMRSGDYIGLAGRTERSGSADRIIVIRRRTGAQERGGDILMERGDTVYMPLTRRHVILEYLSFIGPVTSLIITAAAVGIIGN